jgi:hypothetical protein
VAMAVKLARWRGLISPLLIASYTAACHSWQPVGPTPAAYLREHQASAVRVTRSDGTLLELKEPRVVGDTLMGLRLKDSGQVADSLSLPVGEIHTLAVRESDTGRTLALVGGFVALGIIGCVASNCGISTWGN